MQVRLRDQRALVVPRLPRLFGVFARADFLPPCELPAAASKAGFVTPNGAGVPRRQSGEWEQQRQPGAAHHQDPPDAKDPPAAAGRQSGGVRHT